MNFQYYRQNSTPEKKNQGALQRVVSPLGRKLMYKILNFIDRV